MTRIIYPESSEDQDSKTDDKTYIVDPESNQRTRAWMVNTTIETGMTRCFTRDV
jgi:outer membrane lipoprotein-sorting protein